MNQYCVRPAAWGRLGRWLIGLCALLAAACQSSRTHPPQWKTAELESKSERVLWQVGAMVLDKEGFPTGSGLDPTSMLAVSGWRNDLSPFRGKGYREQAQLGFESLGGGRWKVRVRVKREVNMDIVRPLDLQFAKWESAADAEERALVLLQRMRSWMQTPGVYPTQAAAAGG